MRPQLRLVALLALIANASASLQYMGVAIAGMAFGCSIEGVCPLNQVAVPLPAYDGGNGPGQMQHFANNDSMNIFRLPASWQFLLDNSLGGKLSQTNFEAYDQVMQACLSTGAYCLIDVHNYARWNGGIIGQGGPSDDDFVDLWVQLSSKYKANHKVVFGIMNEPHDLDIGTWGQTCQKVVTAIRNNGATSQMILLPGTNFTNALTFVSTGSAAALDVITNPDGSQDGLLMDLHKYLDENNSGTHETCTTDNVQAFEDISQWLRDHNRTAMVSETGASMHPSCMRDFCAQNQCINQNSDVLVGFVGWAAGSFSTSYMLSLTPTEQNGQWTDNKLMVQCILDEFLDRSSSVGATSTSASASTSAPPATTRASQAKTTTADSPTPTDAKSAKPAKTSSSQAWSTRPIGAQGILASLGFLHLLASFF